MTNDDRFAALTLALEPYQRDGKGGASIGGLAMNKREGHGFAYEAAELLANNHGTINWDMEHPLTGRGTFRNIYEYMAAMAYAPGADLRTQMEAGEEYAHRMKTGVNTVRSWIEETWGILLYACTTKGKNISVLTIYGDLEINEDTGETAAERQVTRDLNALSGQAGAAYTRIGRVHGEKAAITAMKQAVKSATETKLPQPKRARLGQD